MIFKDLEIEPNLLSVTSVNQFTNYNSSSRMAMFNGHLAQMLALNNGDERIVQSGIEQELAKYSFKKKLPANSRIIANIPRYRGGISSSSINHVVDRIIIFENLETEEYDYLEIPAISDYHQYFGFKYVLNKDVMNTLSTNDILPKDTVLADAHTIGDNNGYKFGAVLNMVMMEHLRVAEDAVVFSESAAKKLSVDIYERRRISYGVDEFPLNIYGDEDNYKPFPEIGEQVHESGLLMALREHDEISAPGLVSKTDTMDYNPMFDNCVYVKKPGGTVIDIRVEHSPKYRKEAYSGTVDLVDKYTANLKNFYK